MRGGAVRRVAVRLALLLGVLGMVLGAVLPVALVPAASASVREGRTAAERSQSVAALASASDRSDRTAAEELAVRGERRCPERPEQPGERGTGGCGRVLVVGVPGLRWSDVGESTPVLQGLVDGGALGALSVKAVPDVTCRADGWLTLGAGNRAVATGVGRGPCGDDLPGDLRGQQEAQDAEREGAQLDALVAAVGGCVDARGDGPELLAGERAGPDCDLVLAETAPVAGTGTSRAAAAVRADAALGELLASTRVEQVLVVGLSAAAGEDDPALHVALASGRAFDPGALVSASTGRAPYVQLVDVAPTVLDLLGRPVPPEMSGQPWRSQGEAPTPAELADLALEAQVHRDVTVPFFVVLLAVELVLLVGLAARRRYELAELVALGGTAALGASYLANLVPWWRSPAPLLTLLAVVVLVSAAVAGLATRAAAAGASAERRLLRPVGVACGATALVLLVDLLTGAHLQMSSVAGYSPLVAGRFAGIGNVAFGVLATSVLLATAALTRRASVVAAVGLVAVVLDGAPPFGSDVGGVLALVPAFALLALLLSGRRVTAARLLLAGAAGALVVTAFALADWSRAPGDRTHLGRFVQDVVDGTAGTLLRRKAEAVLDLLLRSPLTALLPLLVAVAVYLVLRPPAPLAEAFRQAPAWRSGLAAVGLAALVGFLVNDSGAAVPALALVVALPATVAVVLRAHRTGRRAPGAPLPSEPAARC